MALRLLRLTAFREHQTLSHEGSPSVGFLLPTFLSRKKSRSLAIEFPSRSCPDHLLAALTSDARIRIFQTSAKRSLLPCSAEGLKLIGTAPSRFGAEPRARGGGALRKVGDLPHIRRQSRIAAGRVDLSRKRSPDAPGLRFADSESRILSSGGRMVDALSSRKLLRPAQAILLGGLTVGTLDILDAIIFWRIRTGASAMRIFQSIAGGFYGRATFQGGIRTAIIGGLVHYFIAFSVVSTYVVVSQKMPLLTRKPILCGTVYGLAVLAFMNLVVLPFSAVGFPHWVLPVAINQVLIHIVGVGIVTALFARATQPAKPAAPPVAPAP